MGRYIQSFRGATLSLFLSFLFSQALIQSHSFHGAFVFPVSVIKGKKYLIVAREAGGRDKGTYCIPGGSSRGWFWRERDPLKTAAHELVEELLLPWSTQEAYQKLNEYGGTCCTHTIYTKTLVTYELPLSEREMNDTLDHYYQRRDSYFFWQYTYREMDRIGVIKLKDLKRVLNKQHGSHHCTLYARVRNPKTNADEWIPITLRPVMVALARDRYT